MAGIVIINENVNPDIFEALSSVCPFGAFEYEGGRLSLSAACKMCKLCIKNGPAGILELVEDEIAEIDKTQYRGITVYVDHVEGVIHPVTFELIGKARELAAVIDHPVQALLIGHQLEAQAQELLHYGVDNVYVYDDEQLKHFVIEPYANAFADYIRQVNPSSILVGATNVGRSLAPRVAARFRTGLTADCTVLEMKENTDLVQIRPAFGGNIMAQIVTGNNRPQFCTVRYKIFSAPERTANTSGKIVKLSIPEDQLRSVIDVIDIKPKEKSIDISEADTIVAVGRGIKSQKDMLMVETLAEALNAQVACTRPNIENGWFDPRLQIGLSGRTVKPKLIITLGISGAVQFVAGMQNADFIIAVNKDPDAPIFNIAHCGIVGDLYEIIPELLAMIDAEKGIQKGEVV